MPPLSLEGLIVFFGGNALCAIAVAIGTVAVAYHNFIAPRVRAQGPAPAQPTRLHSSAGAIAGPLGIFRIWHGDALVETSIVYEGLLRWVVSPGADAVQRFLRHVTSIGVPPPWTGQIPMPAVQVDPSTSVAPRVWLQAAFGADSPISLLLPAERRPELHESRAACMALAELTWLLHRDWTRRMLPGPVELYAGNVVVSVAGHGTWDTQPQSSRAVIVRYLHRGQAEPRVVHDVRIVQLGEAQYAVEYPLALPQEARW
jgi:hypothetical protein